MDFGTIIGIIFGIVLVLGSIIMSGPLSAFIDIPSMMIVLGGTMASTMVAYPMASVFGALKAAMGIFFTAKVDHVETVREVLKAADAVRREGPLALEKMKAPQEFTKTAYQLVADGYQPDDIRDVLSIELDALTSRHAEVVSVLEKMAELAPAWGMIGTLIGLVIMLLNLSDPSKIGPAMAVALLTTFYGALLANFFLTPSATKMQDRGRREIDDYRLVLEGAVSLARGENPRAVQQRLMGFMPPEDRAALNQKAMQKKKK